MRTPTRLFTLLVFLLLGACSSPGYFAPAPPANPDNAVVYLYRPAATNPGKKPLTTRYPEILVDGNSVGMLRYKEHLRVELPPGTHEFVATGLTPNARWEPQDRRYGLTLEPGDVKYLRFRVEFNTDKMSIGTFRGQYIINLHAIAESEAIYQIRETKPAGG